jgi:hypothetical protein
MALTNDLNELIFIISVTYFLDSYNYSLLLLITVMVGFKYYYFNICITINT